MEKKYEKFLWDTMEHVQMGSPFPRDVIQFMVDIGFIDNAKQAWRTLEKWERKGIYEYGSVLDLGWKVKDPQKPSVEAL